jgi:hypothetical protein
MMGGRGGGLHSSLLSGSWSGRGEPPPLNVPNREIEESRNRLHGFMNRQEK